MKRIKLHLTGVSSVITEAAEKRIETEEDYQIPTCDNGKNADWYDDMNIPLPDSLVKKIKQQEKGVELKDEDFEEQYSHISLYEDEIVFKVTDSEGTTIFVKGGYTLEVLETVDEIDSYIDYQNLNCIEKLILYIKMKFYKNEYSEKGN